MTYNKVKQQDKFSYNICGSTTTLTFKFSYTNKTKDNNNKRYLRWHLINQKYCCDRCHRRLRDTDTRQKGNMSFHEFYFDTTK